MYILNSEIIRIKMSENKITVNKQSQLIIKFKFKFVTETKFGVNFIPMSMCTGRELIQCNCNTLTSV